MRRENIYLKKLLDNFLGDEEILVEKIFELLDEEEAQSIITTIAEKNNIDLNEEEYDEEWEGFYNDDEND